MDLKSVCFSCKKDSTQVRIYDAVKEARSVKVCENCAKMEGVILIRKPTSGQLQGANRTTSVYSRLQKLSGLSDAERAKEYSVKQMFPNNQTSTDQRGNDEFSQYSIKKRQEMMKKLTGPVALIEHANWVVQKERRNKRLTIKQLADAIGASETDVKLIEEGKMPTDARRIAEKLEQYFQIKIIKDDLRTPGFNKAAVYRSVKDYDYTRPSLSREAKNAPTAELLVERIPAEKQEARETRNQVSTNQPNRSAFQARPLPTTKSSMSSVSTPSASTQQMNHGIPMNAGASSSRITNRTQMSNPHTAPQQASTTQMNHGIPLNAGASSSRITNKSQASSPSNANYQSPLNTRTMNTGKPGFPSKPSTPHPGGAKLGLSLAADALKTQNTVGQLRPTGQQYQATQQPTQSKPAYAVPNPSRVTGGSSGRPTLSLAADAMKNAQNIPRVQDAKKLQVGKNNMEELTISQLQEIKKQREEAMEEKKKEEENWKGEIEFVDLD